MKVHARSNALGSLKLPLVLLFGVMSCTGEVSDFTGTGSGTGGSNAPSGAGGSGGAAGTSVAVPPQTGGTGGAGSATGGAGGAGGAGGHQAPAAALPGTWRRLTVNQYRHTVDDLFGTGVTYDKLEGEAAVNGFTTVGATQVGTSASGVEQFEAAASKIAAQVVADPTRLAKVVTCTPVPAQFDEACATTSVTKFGRRAFRRPLEATEVTRYVSLWRTLATKGTFTYGAGGVVSAMLQSPKFLYRLEYGKPMANSTVRRFSGHELASRLSYVLWSTTPDDALLDSADKGELDTDAGVAKAAETMLASPKARVGLRDFFAEYMYLGDFGVNDGSARALPPALATAMREQALLDAEDIVFNRDTRFSELFDGTRTHLNATLAQHYGIPGVTGNAFVPVTLPANGERVGFLGSGAFLVRQGDGIETMPSRRGKVILDSFLCITVPPPPDDVTAALPEVDPTKPMTKRQRLAAHATLSRCSTCHTLTDPPGFALEKFDAAGKARTTEAGLTIDASGEFEGKKFSGPRELATLMAASESVAACTVSRFFRYAAGVAEDAADEQRIEPIKASFTASQGKLRPAILAYLKSSLFTQASEPR